MASTVLGKIFGRTSTDVFKFKIQGPVKKWDYIKVNHVEVGQTLAQVIEIEKTGTDTIANCIVIGYRNERGFLRKPRTPFAPDTEVFDAESAFIESILGLKKTGLYLGLLEGKDDLKTFLDPHKLITKHLAVLAKSGAGKSYAIGVLLEELASFGVPVLVLDPHGEYSSMKYANDFPEDVKYFNMYGISAQGFSNRVKEFAINTQINLEAEQLKLAIPNDPFNLVETLPFKATAPQKGLLYSLVNELLERKGKFTFEELIEELEFSESAAKWRLIGSLQSLQKTGLFSFSPTSAAELVRPNQMAILNFKGAPTELQETAVRSVVNMLFEQRKLENIPPFFLVVEEAHNYCPDRGFGEARSSKILRAVASEGRKFGLGLCIISQRPARVDKNVLSQCTSQIALQVTNPNDLKAIASSFEGITAETENEIKNLPIGKSLVIGACDHPVFVDVRVRKSRHGGRAKVFEMAQAVEDPNGAVFIPERKVSEINYIFEPRLSKKEIVTLESQKVEDVSLVLRPCLSLICSQGSANFHLVFDLIDFQLYLFDKNLNAVKIPLSLMSLSPVQKKVLGIAMAAGHITISDLFMKSGLNYNEIQSVVESLVRVGLLGISGRIISAASALDFKKANFLLKPKIMDLPGTEKLSPRISESQVLSFLQNFNVAVNAKKLAYLPFFRVRTAGGEKLVDALGYSLRL